MSYNFNKTRTQHTESKGATSQSGQPRAGSYSQSKALTSKNWRRRDDDSADNKALPGSGGSTKNSSTPKWLTSGSWRDPPINDRPSDDKSSESRLSDFTWWEWTLGEVHPEMTECALSRMPSHEGFDRRGWLPRGETRKQIVKKAIEQAAVNLQETMAEKVGDEEAMKSFLMNEKPKWYGAVNIHDAKRSVYATWSVSTKDNNSFSSGKGREVLSDLSVLDK